MGYRKGGCMRKCSGSEEKGMVVEDGEEGFGELVWGQ